MIVHRALEKHFYDIPKEDLVKLCLCWSVECFSYIFDRIGYTERNNIESVISWLEENGKDYQFVRNIKKEFYKIKIGSGKLEDLEEEDISYVHNIISTRSSRVIRLTAEFALNTNVHNVKSREGIFSTRRFVDMICLEVENVLGSVDGRPSYIDVYLKSLTTINTGKRCGDVDFDDVRELKMFFYDFLQDNESNLVIEDFEGVFLNLPEGWNVFADSIGDLIEIIHGNFFLKNYLRQLFH